MHLTSKSNDGLVDIRFATARRVLDNGSYPPTRDGRAAYVPLGINSCPTLTMAPRTIPRFDWCYNDADDLSASAIDTGTEYMASGYLLSGDGAEVMLYSGGQAQSHGGGGSPVPNGVGTVGSISPHSGIRRHALRRDGFVGVEAGYGGAHADPTKWPQLLTVPLLVPRASECASGDVELQANLISGVSGGAFFQLEQDGLALPNHTLADSVLLAGNWISGPVSWGDDDPDVGARVVTAYSGQRVQIRVAMRDAELFSLSFACTQRPHYTFCLWRHAPAGRATDCAAFGPHYKTIPCSSDSECRGYGTCGGVEARCTNSTPTAAAERVCVVVDGPEKGPLCGWY